MRSAPFLDQDLVKFFQALPYQYRFAQRLYKQTLAQRYANAASIRWSKTGRAVPGTAPSILAEFYLGGAARQIVKRVPQLARRKPDRVRSCRVIGDEMRRDVALRTAILDPFVSGDQFPDELLERDGVFRVIAEHWDGAQNHWHQISCLVTLALVVRQFGQSGETLMLHGANSVLPREMA